MMGSAHNIVKISLSQQANGFHWPTIEQNIQTYLYPMVSMVYSWWHHTSPNFMCIAPVCSTAVLLNSVLSIGFVQRVTYLPLRIHSLCSVWSNSRTQNLHICRLVIYYWLSLHGNLATLLKKWQPCTLKATAQDRFGEFFIHYAFISNSCVAFSAECCHLQTYTKVSTAKTTFHRGIAKKGSNYAYPWICCWRKFS